MHRVLTHWIGPALLCFILGGVGAWSVNAWQHHQEQHRVADQDHETVQQLRQQMDAVIRYLNAQPAKGQ